MTEMALGIYTCVSKYKQQQPLSLALTKGQQSGVSGWRRLGSVQNGRPSCKNGLLFLKLSGEMNPLY